MVFKLVCNFYIKSKIYNLLWITQKRLIFFALIKFNIKTKKTIATLFQASQWFIIYKTEKNLFHFLSFNRFFGWFVFIL